MDWVRGGEHQGNGEEMNLAVIISPGVAPRGVGVFEPEGLRKLEARSGCCLASIYYGGDAGSWYCSECHVVVSKDLGRGIISASVCYFEQGEDELRKWASWWTGFPEERLTVSIRS